MSTNQPQLSTIIAAAVGVIGGAYCAYQVYQRANKRKLPENWIQVGTLSHMYAYPIKSCGPVIVDQAECTFMGLKDFWLRDRVFMIVDNKNNFITARAYPDLVLVHPTFKGSVLTLTHNDMEPISINLAEVVSSKEHSSAVVWGTRVPVITCGPQVGEWFSRLLLRSPTGLQMVYYASENCRVLRDKTDKKLFKFTKNDTGALPDETSFNLINEASIHDLNSRLTTEVSHRNFRPNFVLDGAKAFDEDNWKFIKIGENVFEIIKPCVRCILTTIDPETGIRDSKAEPLETLKSYRQAEDPMMRKSMGTSPRMGVQMALRSATGGRIKLNDPIFVPAQ